MTQMILIDDIDDSEFYDTQSYDEYDTGIVLDEDDTNWNYNDETEERLIIMLSDI
jgi:hypothetical protein